MMNVNFTNWHINFKQILIFSILIILRNKNTYTTKYMNKNIYIDKNRFYVYGKYINK